MRIGRFVRGGGIRVVPCVGGDGCGGGSRRVI